MEKQKTFLQQSSPALSIMISVVLIAVIVLFSIGVTTIVVDSARQGANVRQGTTAYYAAEAGIEQALWINKTLTDAGTAIGANTSGAGPAGGTNVSSNFKILGTTEKLLEQTVNGKYIVPFPWTGNAPWHGDGSIPTGGCNPETPPLRGGSGNNKTVLAKNIYGADVTVFEIDHPCNWNKLKVGEKASIPLYSFVSGNPVSYHDFRLRVRTPCKDGAEICNPSDRLELNCFDKGTGEKKCVASPPAQLSFNKYRGEVNLLWNINAVDGASGETFSMTPLEATVGPSGYYRYDTTDTQLYENKINDRRKGFSLSTLDLNQYTVLNPQLDADGAVYPTGGTPSGSQLDSGTKTIAQFLTDYTKPVLNVSVVGNLIGCVGKISCDPAVDYIGGSGYPNNVPYIEYQVILDEASGSMLPTNKENVISAEGQSGPFDQTIQVKVPHDNSTLEYVIQQ